MMFNPRSNFIAGFEKYKARKQEKRAARESIPTRPDIVDLNLVLESTLNSVEEAEASYIGKVHLNYERPWVKVEETILKAEKLGGRLISPEEVFNLVVRHSKEKIFAIPDSIVKVIEGIPWPEQKTWRLDKKDKLHRWDFLKKILYFLEKDSVDSGSFFGLHQSEDEGGYHLPSFFKSEALYKEYYITVKPSEEILDSMCRHQWYAKLYHHDWLDALIMLYTEKNAHIDLSGDSAGSPQDYGISYTGHDIGQFGIQIVHDNKLSVISPHEFLTVLEWCETILKPKYDKMKKRLVKHNYSYLEVIKVLMRLRAEFNTINGWTDSIFEENVLILDELFPDIFPDFLEYKRSREAEQAFLDARANDDLLKDVFATHPELQYKAELKIIDLKSIISNLDPVDDSDSDSDSDSSDEESEFSDDGPSYKPTPIFREVEDDDPLGMRFLENPETLSSESDSDDDSSSEE